jgi:hypothetical protein
VNYRLLLRSNLERPATYEARLLRYPDRKHRRSFGR